MPSMTLSISELEEIQEAREAGKQPQQSGDTAANVLLDPLAKAIEQFMATTEAEEISRRARGKAGRPSDTKTFEALAEIGDPSLAASLIVEGILQAIVLRGKRRDGDDSHNAVTAPRVTSNIARVLSDELKTRCRRIRDRSHFIWPVAKSGRIGADCLHLFLESMPGCVEIRDVRGEKLKGKDKKYSKDLKIVVPMRGLVELVTPEDNPSSDASPARALPQYLPMALPPKPWTNTRDGGYRYSMQCMDTFIKHAQKDFLRSIDREIPDEFPITVYKAVNAIQETSWAVNERVLKVVKEIIAGGLDLAGVVARPSDDDDTDDDSVKHVQKRVSQSSVISIAEMLLLQQGDAPFYFPHNVDFTGRVYPLPHYLQPQGNDLPKGLLHFAEAKALGSQDAVKWLAIHGANCMAEHERVKLDEKSHADRVQWVNDHSDNIRAVAKNPIKHIEWWKDADSPLCFLAFCFEWAGYLAACERGMGLAFESRIPIAQDGSCNGLQHYSALLRDEAAGKAVNMVPSEIPRDIYQDVAVKVKERLTRDAPTDCCAKAWLDWGGVDRKICKRPVMTLAYGTVEWAFRGQIATFLLDDLPSHKRPDFAKADGFNKKDPHCVYMAKAIWVALDGVVNSAKGGLKFLRSAVDRHIENDLAIQWTAPSGFHVVQQNWAKVPYQIGKTLMGGGKYRPTYEVRATDEEATALKYNTRKQRDGIAPNFIHSLDAAHLMLTTCAAVDEDVTHFAMIHDSFGTHAADAEKLARITREQFVKMYTPLETENDFLNNDILLDFVTSLLIQVRGETAMKKTLDATLRKARGTLDLQGVIKSKYFFS